MEGKRKRARRGRHPVLGALVAITAVAVVLVPLGLRDAPSSVDACCAVAAATQPTKVASPRYLDTTYTAPVERMAEAAGRLNIHRLGLSAAVVGVGWDREAMSVPDDPRILGWFSPSARFDDLAGVSLVAGHVSDSFDRAGPLARLENVRVGDVVEWRGVDSRLTRFRVVAIGRYPRAQGLPTSLFRADGPHTLRLVTCSSRRASPRGIHYVDNLVVSAVAE